MMCKKRKKDRNFRENGGMVLKHQRVRIFSEAELEKATKNYDDDQKLEEGGFGSVYKGVLADNAQVAVKKFKGVDKAQMNEEFQNEMGVVSQVNHKNVVKLLGLCLETKVPLLVYEFISNGTLFKHIHDKTSQLLASWSNRLRIASEIALALNYLHSLADPHPQPQPMSLQFGGTLARARELISQVPHVRALTCCITKSSKFNYFNLIKLR
jgi:serine/threonine protein kinase